MERVQQEELAEERRLEAKIAEVKAEWKRLEAKAEVERRRLEAEAEVERKRASGSKVLLVASSGRKRGAKQLEVEIPVAKWMRVTKMKDAEEEDVRAAFWREVLIVLSRLVSRVERIAAVAEGMEFRRRQERRGAEKETDKDVEGSEEESSEESDEEME